MHDTRKKILQIAKREDIGTYGLRKLGEKIGVDHPQKVKWHLNKLINDGHLVRTATGSIALSSPQNLSGKMLRVPILGMANCGEPLSVADDTHHGNLTLSPSLIGHTRKANHCFAVQATGDSMNKASIDGKTIDDGDYAIVDSSIKVPSTGQYVVSSIEGLANIKKYIRDEENHVIALVSESTKPRPPIIIDPNDTDSYHVHGIVVGVIKTAAYL